MKGLIPVLTVAVVTQLYIPEIVKTSFNDCSDCYVQGILLEVYDQECSR